MKSPSVCGPGTHRNLFCSQGANWTCLGQKHKGVGSPGRMLPRDGSKRGVQLMIVSPDLLSTQGLKCCLSSETHEGVFTCAEVAEAVSVSSDIQVQCLAHLGFLPCSLSQ